MESFKKIMETEATEMENRQTSDKLQKQTTQILPTSNIRGDAVAQKVGQILDRFSIEQGWNIRRTTNEDKIEHANRVKFWIENLATGKVPVKEFDAVYLRCIQNRAAAKATNQPVTNKLTPDDFLAAWFQILSEKSDDELITRSFECEFYDHDSRTGTMEIQNPYNRNENITLPCAYCRPSEYETARREFINTSGEINPMDILSEIAQAKKEEQSDGM